MSNKIHLAQKIKALSDNAGTAGEREAALSALERMMKAHGISYEDIEGEDVLKFVYKTPISDPFLQDLICQVCASVIPKRLYGPIMKSAIRYRRLNRLSATGWFLGCECTRGEFIEIIAKYEFYKLDFLRNQKAFFHAYVLKNKLVNPNAKQVRASTPEDLKVLEMMGAIEKKDFHKQIEP